MTLPRFPIAFDDGQVALAVRAHTDADLPRSLRAMGLTTGVPTLVPVSAGSRPAQLSRLRALLEKVVVAVAEAVDATVVDEGDRDGVGALLGQVRRHKKAGFPLVGVAAEGEGREELDSEHTHFVLVPTDSGADRARWISTVATAVSGGNRSVALVAAGGEPAWEAVAAHVRAGRLVMAVGRSGGVADHLAAALAGQPADGRARSLAATGQVCALDPGRGASSVADMVRTALSRPNALNPGRSPSGR
ncbi:MAG TPA: hypothetical protein VHF27_10305 [Acidimicrobiales bacterium]|nr:hypothetical protein [Acidimicrobiales bacterium]